MHLADFVSHSQIINSLVMHHLLHVFIHSIVSKVVFCEQRIIQLNTPEKKLKITTGERLQEVKGNNGHVIQQIKG